MGAIRNAKRANAKTHAIPKSGKRGHSEHHHQHADGKAHAHAQGSAPHEHETSAQRFARRYPNGQPFGAPERGNGQAHGPPAERPEAPTGTGGQWWDRHVLAVILIALIGALALIAVFTPTGENKATGAPVAPVATATARIVVHWQPRATATSTPRATATPAATPCQAPTLPYCEAPPTEQARPAQPAIDGPTTEPTPSGASVGGTLVPSGLRCQEDELIGYVGNDVLGCVHVEGRTLEPLNPDTY